MSFSSIKMLNTEHTFGVLVDLQLVARTSSNDREENGEAEEIIYFYSGHFE